jgi:hypothetical protein
VVVAILGPARTVQGSVVQAQVVGSFLRHHSRRALDDVAVLELIEEPSASSSPITQQGRKQQKRFKQDMRRRSSKKTWQKGGGPALMVTSDLRLYSEGF